MVRLNSCIYHLLISIDYLRRSYLFFTQLYSEHTSHFYICVLNSTITDERESLNFKLKGTKDYETLAKMGDNTAAADNNLGSWGHEFVRSLAGEIGQEYNARVIAGADPDDDAPFADLLGMVDIIVPFNVEHNAEAEAIDLLIEVQRLKKVLDLDSIDEKNYKRVCLYLIKTADFMSDPDDYMVSSTHNFPQLLSSN